MNFISTYHISLMCCLETKVKIANSIAISKRINKNWMWAFNYEHHDNGRRWLGWDPSIWKVNIFEKSALTHNLLCYA